jgi:hypothetical protein
VLRKTMLDECKGERLEEILAVFSTAVLRKAVEEAGAGYHEAMAQRLAMENFSYNGERGVLSTVVLAHKGSLSRTLRLKNEAKARYNDFNDLLRLKDRQTARRHEQLKASVEEEGENNSVSKREAWELQDIVQKNWSGNNEWMETILHGDSRFDRDGLLASSYEDVWNHIEDGTIDSVENSQKRGLLEQLDARVREQNHRLARWQDFEKTLAKDLKSGTGSKISDKSGVTKGIDLGFSLHESLQLNRNPKKTLRDSASLGEYATLIDNMQFELANVGKPRRVERVSPARPAHPEDVENVEMDQATSEWEDEPESADVAEEENHLSASDAESAQRSPSFENYPTKSRTQTPPVEPEFERRISPVVESHTDMSDEIPETEDLLEEYTAARSVSNHSVMPPQSPPNSSALASEILASVMTTSPSPTKPRHVLSLAERTRLSMSRTSIAHHSLEDLDDLPDLYESLAIKSPTPVAPSAGDSSSKHEDLIARTRLSMSNFANVSKNAQIERRRSVKLAAKAKRASYMPKRLEAPVEELEDGIDKMKLIEGEVEPDYELVFKSRPRIKTSPETSPVKAWQGMGGERAWGSSSPTGDQSG